jgi:hypothetical protein
VHHKIVDDDPEAYTEARLRKMKTEHEARAGGLGAEEIEHGSRLLIAQPVTSIGQSGGITAHTVNQTIHVHSLSNAGSSRRSAIITRLRAFHEERTDAIAKGTGGVSILKDGTLLIHILPLSQKDRHETQAFAEIARNPQRFRPVGRERIGYLHDRTDYEGLLVGSNNDGLDKPQRAYVKVFRWGALEAVASSLARGRDDRFLILPDLQETIVQYVHLYLQSLNACGVLPPMAVFVSLFDIKGRELLQTTIERGAIPEDLPSQTLDRERLQFGESVFESIPVERAQCAVVLRPILDHLANAAGLPAATCFDAQGRYL